jgi:PAS domain S-box-containing protein
MPSEGTYVGGGNFADLERQEGSDALYRQLLDTAPDAVVVVDEAGRIVLVNLQTEVLFGYGRDELIGRNVEILIPNRLRARHVQQREGFVERPKVRAMGSGLDLFGRRQNGSEFPLEISLSPLQTKNGILVSASIRDITDRKQAELRTHRLQAHLLSALESIQGAFAIFDSQDRLVLCNSECRQLLGRDVEGEITGLVFEELVDVNVAAGTFDVADPADLRARWLGYHREPSGTLDVRTRDGRNLRVVERRTADGGLVTTISDVTEDVEREEELSRARRVAEAASSAKSEFLASMSHELRTPLNAILGFAQLLMRDKKMPLPERHRERVDHVLKGGEHLLRLIDEVLDLSRIEAGQVTVSPEPVSVVDVLAEVKATLGPMAARAAVELVVLPVPEGLPMVVADRTRFKQILMNYGSNAIKYGREGGRATFHAAAGRSGVRVCLADDGIGIPSDKQDKLFQAFFRAGQETGPIEGTGIGLAITKRLAELMGGSVGFRSEEGKGSEFWIELAEHCRDVSASPVPRSNSVAELSALSGPDGQRYLIVYVEDNPSNIAFMTDLIQDFERVELITAPTAEIGLEIVRAAQPNVVIMDINLPGMSGFEATRRLRDWPETREIPIVALSAAAMLGDRARMRDAGFYRYLTKPVKVDELTKVLEELLLPATTP